MAYEPDTWSLGGRTFTSRFILGSGKFNLDLVEAAVRDAGAEIVTLAVRRANTGQDESILDAIPEGVTLLPNTSGARTAEEAVRIARLARAMGCGDFVKVEVIRDAAYLMPDNAETVRGPRRCWPRRASSCCLCSRPRLRARPGAGGRGGRSCRWRRHRSWEGAWRRATSSRSSSSEVDVPVIVDAVSAGRRRRCEAMELGAAAVMVNAAVATAGDVPPWRPRSSAPWRRAARATSPAWGARA